MSNDEGNTMETTSDSQPPSDYRASHPDLTEEQYKLLDWADDVVAKSDRSQVKALKKACKEAFGDDEAVYILTGKDRSANRAATRLTRRERPECGCDHNDEYCGDGFGCKLTASWTTGAAAGLGGLVPATVNAFKFRGVVMWKC
ncbi:hypothetical protein K440DRAFT_644277 [Wilcoxina mikolae CBS 423.85]|nr:hypothetical protein K440DRAFT_644277 [Wilcoxina mikolae CBS 423.85]